jgi:hypothetical protein
VDVETIIENCYFTVFIGIHMIDGGKLDFILSGNKIVQCYYVHTFYYSVVFCLQCCALFYSNETFEIGI